MVNIEFGKRFFLKFFMKKHEETIIYTAAI